MGLILLEALLALVVLVLIVWWTMFSGRKGGELTTAAAAARRPARRRRLELHGPMRACPTTALAYMPIRHLSTTLRIMQRTGSPRHAGVMAPSIIQGVSL